MSTLEIFWTVYGIIGVGLFAFILTQVQKSKIPNAGVFLILVPFFWGIMVFPLGKEIWESYKTDTLHQFFCDHKFGHKPHIVHEHFYDLSIYKCQKCDYEGWRS